MSEYTFSLLDADYELDKEGKPIVRLFGRTAEGESIVALDSRPEPYFYASGGAESIKAIGGLKSSEFQIRRVEKIARKFKGKKGEFLKIFTQAPNQVPAAREEVRRLTSISEIYEADILYNRRYLIDNKLEPMSMVHITAQESDRKFTADHVVSVETIEETLEPLSELRVLGFDIESYNPKGMPQAEQDPIIMISAAGKDFQKVFTYKGTENQPAYVEVLKDEKEMLARFLEFVREQDADILVGYNSDNFDMPYIQTRCELLGVPFLIGRSTGKVQFKSKGTFSAAQTKGRVHADLYHYVNYILRGTVQLKNRKLKTVAEFFLKEGEGKKDVDVKEIGTFWEAGGEKLNELFEYNLRDSVVTWKLANLFLPRIYEIAKLVRVPLFDAARMTYGQLVEAYMIWNAYQDEEIVPNRPGQEERDERAAQEAFEGAYVKDPEVGLHENVALFDFRSLYPTIIISHNIEYSTIDCDCCNGAAKKVEDTGHWFCEKREGLMPRVLREILDKRIAIKTEMKKIDRDAATYATMDNRQYALKILANSAYGYLAYRGSRWYTREGGRCVTALGRMYVKRIIDKAAAFQLRAIYGDTDSLFVVAESGSVEAIAPGFMAEINKELPGVMELEFEGVYRRAIFVSKKRYALIDAKGRTTIKGLEFVRKDWSPISKETQKAVIDSLLADGNAEKAFHIVRAVIKRLQNGEVPVEELAVYTELTRALDKYQVTAPHVAVGEMLKRRGEDIRAGTSIGYVITNGGGKISERARPVEDVKPNQVDTTYYVEHQMVPAVSRVMEAFGYTEGDLLGKKQMKLGAF